MSISLADYLEKSLLSKSIICIPYLEEVKFRFQKNQTDQKVKLHPSNCVNLKSKYQINTTGKTPIA